MDVQTVIVEDKDDLHYMGRKVQKAYQQRGLIMNKKKCEYMIFGNNEKEDLSLEVNYVSEVDKCKYLRVPFTKNGNSNKEINNRANKGRNVIRSLNSILWNKGLRKIKKKRIYKSMVQSVTWNKGMACKLERTGTNC
jgi:hypothetical protein